MRKPILLASTVIFASALIAACSGSSKESGFEDGGSSGSGSGGSGSGSGGSSGGSGGGSGGSSGSSSGGTFGGSSGSGSGSSSGGTAVCSPNPANYDIPGNNCDDDGDGKVDNVTTCDSTLTAGNGASNTAQQFLQAMGLCQQADATHWGIVSASFTNGHSQTTGGSMNFDEQHGIIGSFGNVIKAREGAMMGVLSSGSATVDDSDTGPQFKGGKDGMQGSSLLGTISNGGDIPTYTQKANSCPALASTVNDVVDLKVQIKVPANAQGFGFDFNFWSGEWPDYVCSNFNDSFIAFLTSQAFQKGVPDNISFDGNGNPISVNNNFFGACTAGVETGCSGNGATATSTCTLGPADLAGTGFDQPEQNYCSGGGKKGGGSSGGTSTSGGSTGWLNTQSAATPGETISLEFVIWDTGDESYDSSVLLDNWLWVPTTATPVPPTPVTNPVK